MLRLSKKSQYFLSLSENDQKASVKKLTVDTDKILPDPFAVTTGWINDVTLLPDVAYPDIYSYLIVTPSECTKDRLKAYKSLEAYNLFVSGHVQDVFINNTCDDTFRYIKSEVLRSQRQGQNQTMYEVWIITHQQGWILCGNCTCMAG